MDTISAFAMGEANRHREQMVFDWEKAARIIVERGAKSASAGLRGDWEYTGGEILKDGIPVPVRDTCTYLSSTWAIPELNVEGDVIECYRMKRDSPGWNAETHWPQEALSIMRAERPAAAAAIDNWHPQPTETP